MRKFLGLLLIVALVGGVWYFFFRTSDATTSQTPTEAFRSFFSRDAATSGVPDDSGVSTQSGDTQEISDPVNPFTRIAAFPVAGYSAFTTTRTVPVLSADPKQKPTTQTITDHFIRLISRTNGYVYEIENGSIPMQITNIYIPNVYEGVFADNNSTAVLRFLRDDNRTIATYSVPIPPLNPDNTRTQQNGTYFAENISSLAVSPDTKNVAQVTHANGSAVLSTTTTKNTAREELATSALNEWLLSWQGQTVYAQTKAASVAPGYLYRIDAGNKRLVRTLGDISGLTTSVSPKGTYILYSESSTSGFRSTILTTKTGVVQTLSIAVLPEKCVWLKNENLICAGTDALPEGTYPDDWYAGVRSFTDNFYRIYSSNGSVDVLWEEIGAYDAINLSADEDRSLLYFIDKPSGILWQFAY